MMVTVGLTYPMPDSGYAPDHIDLPAPPPPGTVVDIGDWGIYIVDSLTLEVSVDSLNIARGRYIAVLRNWK